MIKYCLKKWDANKHILEKALQEGLKWNSCEYIDLVKLVVKCILNEGEVDFEKWDINDITVVDNGDYQGTLLFLIPKETYQPSEYEYLMTYVNYGSCSGCDTLLNIQGYSNEALTESQVKDFMVLCKDILTNIIKPYNCGWRQEEDFEQIKTEKGGVEE